MFIAPSSHSNLLKRVCFLPIFQDIRRVCFPAAFRNLLAVASADISILRDEKDSVQAMIHNARAINLLGKRMSELSNAAFDGTIATIALQIIFQVALFLIHA